jgi:hypothetical protein
MIAGPELEGKLKRSGKAIWKSDLERFSTGNWKPEELLIVNFYIMNCRSTDRKGERQ